MLRFLEKRGPDLVDAGRQPKPYVECSLLVHPLLVALDLNHPHLFAAHDNREFGGGAFRMSPSFDDDAQFVGGLCRNPKVIDQRIAGNQWSSLGVVR